MWEKGCSAEISGGDLEDFSEHASICLLYENASQRDQALAFFLRRALAKNGRVICLCQGERQEILRAGFRSLGKDASDFSIAKLEAGGSLLIIPAEHLFAGEPAPVPHAAADWLQEAREEARFQGYAGLWVFFDMEGLSFRQEEWWFEKFVTALDRLTREGGLFLLSAFNRQIVPPPLVLKALWLYPAILQDLKILPNNYCRSANPTPPTPASGGFVERFYQQVKGLAAGGKNRGFHERLCRQDQALEAIFEAASIGMWLLDKDHRMVFTNQNFSAATGVSAERFLQAGHYSEVMEPEVGVKCMISDALAFNTDGPIQSEEELIGTDGTKHTYQIVKSRILDGEREITGLLGLAIDITDRKKVETDLKEALAAAEDSRDQIDNIIESIADGLIVTDPRNRILLINGRARELLGVGSLELSGAPIGRAIRDLSLLNQVNAIYDHDGRQALETSFQAELSEHEPARSLQARTSLKRNKQGEVTGAITVLRDVTREQELDRIKAEFMSVAAHELRTPLTSILGYLEFCLHPEDFGGFSAAQQYEFLEEINNKAELLAKLVSDVLDISRIEAGRPLPLDIRPINVERLIGKIVDQFRLQASRHRFQVCLEESPAGSVLADEVKLGQVLENLLSNAVKYSPEGSLVRISGLAGDGVYQVSVEDQGIGMTEDQVARVFDKFYRADFSNTAARGLGLGMSIVRQIVERHGGFIWVESEKGRGTRVHFTLPAGNEPVKEA